MKLYVPLAALCAALAPTLSGQAQTVSAETPSAPNTEQITPRKTMFKLGVGFNRGFLYGGYYNLALPTTLGVERRLNSKFSIYGNLMASLRLTRRNFYYGRRASILERGIVALGGRYYYNQAGRAKHGRSAGAFVGNYLALQASTDIHPYFRYNSFDNHLRYDFSAVSALWGMQRRLGSLLVYDLGAGIGLYNPRRSRYSYDEYTGSYTVSYKRRLAVLPELSLSLSLAR